jgi:hypothetical protein
MGKRRYPRAGRVVLAATAVLIFGAGARGDYPEIVTACPAPQCPTNAATGIAFVGPYIYVIAGTDVNYLYKYAYPAGSFVASYPLAGAQVLAEADIPPAGYPYTDFGVVETADSTLKIYDTVGSFVGVAHRTPPEAVAYGVGGHVTNYLNLATRDGVVYRYLPDWSFLNSFSTGVRVGALAAGHGYGGMWGDWIYVGELDSGTYRVFSTNGSLYASFILPGTASRGAVYQAYSRSRMWCLQIVNSIPWAFEVETGPLMDVDPASWGRVKALYR